MARVARPGMAWIIRELRFPRGDRLPWPVETPACRMLRLPTVCPGSRPGIRRIQAMITVYSCCTSLANEVPFGAASAIENV